MLNGAQFQLLNNLMGVVFRLGTIERDPMYSGLAQSVGAAQDRLLVCDLNDALPCFARLCRDPPGGCLCSAEPWY